MKNSVSCVTQKKQQQKKKTSERILATYRHLPSGSRANECPLSVQSTHLTKNTQGAVGLALDESEVLAANSHLTTNAPGDSEAPELPADSEMTD